ncbi:unnamed protein product [Leptosia nina]|uniref:DNA repair metallo-beta-lactamase domain-containing protein n=1 Tax=Leptosia nina TaxID=320188 RepID=A0AAV1IWV4_9NEOP
MTDDDFSHYVPSILNPRSVKKSDLNLTQRSIFTQNSLSLKRVKVPSDTSYKKSVKGLGKKFQNNKENIEISSCVTEKIDFGPLDNQESWNSINFSSKSLSTLESNNSATSILRSDRSLATDLYGKADREAYNVSVSLKHSKITISTKGNSIKNIAVSNSNTKMHVSCIVVESSVSEQESSPDKKKLSIQSRSKRSSASVNLEIKKQKLSHNKEGEKILILKSCDAKLSDVIVQPTNYKFIKQKIQDQCKSVYEVRNGKIGHLKQRSIDSYFANVSRLKQVSEGKLACLGNASLTDKDSAQNVSHDMSRNLCVAARHDTQSTKNGKRIEYCKSPRKLSHRSMSPRVETKESFTPAKVKNESLGSYSPRRIADSIQFSLPAKSKSNKTSTVNKVVPHYKIVAGTHFAVDAFSYGDIPNVRHYFLTHFHSDHYSGLKKGFNKMLFCSKITADLCISRLGVGVKYIHIMNVDETIKIDGVEVTAIDANHCPGAIMLVFSLPNGKTLLHTGDFRASPVMESYPIFWNKDIHTVYLDTTYCNPRYDFPTQDESLERALFHLRQKKTALEKAGKKFSSVLIVCGTYTIGKEKFFLGMARRVGCTVWACPEKDRVLQAVEGRSFSHAPPQSCQLHVVPMRDLTHEKLRSYLDSLQGAFSEVVAFKPSGWENGKNSSVEKDSVTIHGIPYSEHSSFSEMIRFVKYLKPKQVVPTVDISGGIKAVQKYFPCPLVYKEDLQNQAKVTDYFSIQSRHQPAIT